MIPENTYQGYFNNLLKGQKQNCAKVIHELIDQEMVIKDIYEQLFRRSLYQVGDYWERNMVSVATEHMATAITENMMIKLQPHLFTTDRTGKKAVIACVANEYHQVGAKMIADTFEMNGWDGYFIGANTPIKELIRFIESQQPQVIGLSLSIYFNIPELRKTLQQLRAAFTNIPVIFGGQAFRWGGVELTHEFNDVHYLDSISALERFIARQDGKHTLLV